MCIIFPPPLAICSYIFLVSTIFSNSSWCDVNWKGCLIICTFFCASSRTYLDAVVMPNLWFLWMVQTLRSECFLIQPSCGWYDNMEAIYDLTFGVCVCIVEWRYIRFGYKLRIDIYLHVCLLVELTFIFRAFDWQFSFWLSWSELKTKMLGK
jgi:hypothetical protein